MASEPLGQISLSKTSLSTCSLGGGMGWSIPSQEWSVTKRGAGVVEGLSLFALSGPSDVG